jgi:DNA repair exonuclease SbcCD nuclease subunit
MRLLLTADLHLTSRPEHAYRLKYLEWLAYQCESVDAVAILGDISDAKDNHTSSFLNAVTDRIASLSADLNGELYLLFGNHDGPSKDEAYWRFLRHLGLSYVTKFTVMQWSNADQLVFVPFAEETDLLAWLCNPNLRSERCTVLMHTSADNAIVENGTALPNPKMPNTFLPAGFRGKVWSGDIHVPQVLGDIEYVGSPYHTRYGDQFTGRTVIYDTESGAITDLHFDEAPRLLTARVEFPNLHQLQHFLEKNARAGDRLKMVGRVDTAILSQDWNQFMDDARYCAQEFGVTMNGAVMEFTAAKSARSVPSARRSDAAIVRTYASQQGFDEATTKAGLDVLEDGTPNE